MLEGEWQEPDPISDIDMRTEGSFDLASAMAGWQDGKLKSPNRDSAQWVTGAPLVDNCLVSKRHTITSLSLLPE